MTILVKDFNPAESRDALGHWTHGAGAKALRRQVKMKIALAPTPTADEVERNHKLIATSHRPGGELRGNSHDRAARTDKLMQEFGDGKKAPCAWCGRELDAKTLTQDKIYTAHEGGRYKMSNLVPACYGCNAARGDTPIKEWTKRLGWR